MFFGVTILSRDSKALYVIMVYCLQKRGRDAGEGEQNGLDELKAVGHVGKGFVRRIYSLKAPRLN